MSRIAPATAAPMLMKRINGEGQLDECGKGHGPVGNPGFGAGAITQHFDIEARDCPAGG
jgi:hypothetical protein